MVTIDLIVTPRQGVRDPQGDAVEEALRNTGFVEEYGALKVHFVGRTLRLDIPVDDGNFSEAKKIVAEMCERLLVNPNLETYEIRPVVPHA